MQTYNDPEKIVVFSHATILQNKHHFHGEIISSYSFNTSRRKYKVFFDFPALDRYSTLDIKKDIY